MEITDRVAIPKDVMARQVGDETVILNLTSGTYYGLDAIGARIVTKPFAAGDLVDAVYAALVHA